MTDDIVIFHAGEIACFARIAACFLGDLPLLARSNPYCPLAACNALTAGIADNAALIRTPCAGFNSQYTIWIIIRTWRYVFTKLLSGFGAHVVGQPGCQFGNQDQGEDHQYHDGEHWQRGARYIVHLVLGHALQDE